MKAPQCLNLTGTNQPPTSRSNTLSGVRTPSSTRSIPGNLLRKALYTSGLYTISRGIMLRINLMDYAALLNIDQEGVGLHQPKKQIDSPGHFHEPASAPTQPKRTPLRRACATISRASWLLILKTRSLSGMPALLHRSPSSVHSLGR
jgi:hypothetical protein